MNQEQIPWWQAKANDLTDLASLFESASKECEAVKLSVHIQPVHRPLYSVGQALCEFIAYELRERAEQAAKPPPAPPDFSNERFTNPAQRRK